ncbi:lysine exporter LysO family protein [Fusobacterium mortiferum]|uniref:lysine exporter LysO family protein n=1 Tax=Fusobacterium mortiferum TaxID=850 RepID=UPI000E4D164F|nr:lysine exporter LysO family protein [Fusobacterium mortiferum]RHF63834.1 lysine exporter LysO family protein [Fusobacterium mortiferum]
MLGIIISVIIGILGGLFFKNGFILENVDFFISLGLFLLLFFVGMDIGNNNEVFNQLKNMSKKILLLPIITILGSLIGGAIASYFISLSLGESIAISSGMGWYSFSAIELSKINAHLGGVAFLSNVLREFSAILFIPFIAKKIGSYESVATAGATAMDSVLPVINKNNPPDVAIIAFYSGLVITVIVPILVPSVVSLFKLI